MLALRLLQSALVLINARLVDRVLADQTWAQAVTNAPGHPPRRPHPHQRKSSNDTKRTKKSHKPRPCRTG